jgi:hypothetical protein
VKHPWVVALLLGTVITPAGVVFAWLAPRPLDAVAAFPLVLLDVWAAADGGAVTQPFGRILLLVLGIVLTWLLYVLAARVVLWRIESRG